MADELGVPFAEIEGPGVWLVDAMAELEEFFESMGVDVEYKVEDIGRAFEWPES